MKWYSWSREDFLTKLVLKYNQYIMPEEFATWCLTLPAEFADARDFKAEEAIQLDMDIVLPESFSLWKWIYKTNYQGSHWSCTANSTCHGVQILNVKKGGVLPTDKNIITPSWKDLWTKMGHDVKNYNDSGDYVEKAVNVALKEWVYIEEDWNLARFDWYATAEWNMDDESIDKIKRYLYRGCPIVWVLRWNDDTRHELSLWELRTKPTVVSQGHAIALVGWDKRWMRFVNSWSPNDGKWLKSRFLVSYNKLKDLWGIFNYRYWVLYNKEDENKQAEYLKRKNQYLAILKLLKKTYPVESKEWQKAIEDFSKFCRSSYPEIDQELPL